MRNAAAEPASTVNRARRATDSRPFGPDTVGDGDIESGMGGAAGPYGGGDDGPTILGLLDDDEVGPVSSITFGEPHPEAAAGEVFDPVRPATPDVSTISAALAPGEPDDIIDAIFVDADEPTETGDRPPDGMGITDEVPDISDIPGVFNRADASDAEPAHIPEPADSVPDTAAATDPEPPSLDLDMRQVAGLTSGSSMTLVPGRIYEFSESTRGLSFGVKVLENGQVIVLPGSARAIINEVEVTEPTFLGDGILHVESACFSVRPATPNPSRPDALRADPATPGAITVPPLDRSSKPPPINGRIGDPNSPAGAFLDAVRRSRDRVAERHRLTHPDPQEIKTRLTGLEPGLWERGVDHRHFGRFGVAYATIPWQPRFDTPELIPEHLHQTIVDMSLLPWVPVTANLGQGPLGIVGSRSATLACARHAVLSLAALTAPGDIGFWVLTGRRHVEDWQWTTSLPISMSPEGGASFMVAVVDGMGHFDKAELDRDAVDSGRLGLIALATEEADLPERCGTVLRLQSNGSATVTNHLGETISGTPIGVTNAFALDLAGRIADVLADIGP